MSQRGTGSQVVRHRPAKPITVGFDSHPVLHFSLEARKSVVGKTVLLKSELGFPYQHGRIPDNRKHLESLELRYATTSIKRLPDCKSSESMMKGAAEARYDS
jgi:hypothetical protein